MAHLKRSRTGVRPDPVRVFVAVLATLGLLLAAGCGKDVQTNQPYTPGEGVNVDLGRAVQVRNLLIISRAEGEGFLSATLTANERDALVSVSGTASALDGEGAPLTVTQPNPVSVGPGQIVLLTERTPIMLKSEQLVAGRTAELNLQFSTAGAVTVSVPVVNGADPQYASITPGPVSASPSA